MSPDVQTTDAGARVAEGDFPELADRYRRELFAHCYRMTGSVHDAEDLVQETYLRAWRAYHAFEGRSSVRTWLYRIATNACLTALDGRACRPLPTGLGAPGIDASDELVERGEVPWLQPVPDAMIQTAASDPADVVTSREGIRLAFIAALQYLPPRQRAVLIMRDVLAWRAAEAAQILGTTVVSVNSLLQRARTRMQEVRPQRDKLEEPSEAAQRDLLEAYVTAFWDKDVDKIVSLLAKDATWDMPPFVGWYQGADNIGRLIGTRCPGGAHDMPMVATAANGQPAFGLYMRQPDDSFTPFQLQVLDIGPQGVRHVTAFVGPDLFSTFGLPASLPASAAPAG